MFGRVFLIVYSVIAFVASLLPRDAGRALKARWAFRFATLTDGGLDDDFAEEAFRLILEKPALLDGFESQALGTGFFAMRRRLLQVSLRHALDSGARSLF